MQTFLGCKIKLTPASDSYKLTTLEEVVVGSLLQGKSFPLYLLFPLNVHQHAHSFLCHLFTFQFILTNQCTNCDKTWQVWSLGGP